MTKRTVAQTLGMILATAATAIAALAQVPKVPKPSELPSVSSVKAAVTRLLTKPKEAKDTDLALVVDFAQKSDAVTVEVMPGLVVVPEGKRDSLLLGYFIAGVVKYDLEHPKQATDLRADKESGVKASLLIYGLLQERDKTFKRPLMEKLAELDKKGKLPQYIRSVVENGSKSK